MSNLKFNAIFESTQHAIAFLKLNGAIEETNSLFKLTFRPNETITLPCYLWDVMNNGHEAENKLTVETNLNKAVSIGFAEFTLSCFHSEESEQIFHCTLRCYNDTDGNKAGLVFKAADNTDAVRLRNKLEETSERYNLSMLGSGDGLWDWKIQEDLAFFSPRFRELMGYPAEEYISGMQALLQVLHPEDIERTTTAIQEHLVDKKPFNHEYRLLTVSGEYRWFLVRGQAVWSNQGLPVRMAGSLTDIHRQKQLEAQLQKSYQLQNAVMQTLPDIVLLIDFKWEIKDIFSSKGQFESIGICLNKGQNFINCLSKKHADLFNYALNEIKIKEKTTPFFLELKKGALLHDFEVHLEKLSDNEIVCVLRDITKARSFERELVKNELKYTNLLDNMKIGLLEVDNKETIRFATQPFLELTGYALNEIIGKNAADLFSVNKNNNERLEIISRRKKGISDQYLSKIKTKNGVVKDVIISASPLANPEGNVIGSVGLHIDVTEERKKSNILDKVKAVGKIGTFSLDLIQNKIEWDIVVRSIFEVDDDFVPDIINGISFYKPGESRNRIQTVLKNAIASGSSSDDVYEIVTAKKNSKWIRVVAYVEKNDDIPVKIIGHTLDITEEKLQSIHFEKLKNHYESIASATNEIFFDWHFTDDVLVVNDSYFRITGKDRNKDNLTGASLICGIHPEDQMIFKQSLEKSIIEKKLWEISFRVKLRNEDYITLQIRGRIRFDEMNKPTGVIGIMNDVSNIIALQTKLLEQEVVHQKILGETALTAEQNERQFIGQELHDNVAQLLAVAQLHLSYYLTNPSKNEKILTEGISILGSTIQEIRKLSHRLTGHSLKQEGITQALEELINSLRNLSSIKFNLVAEIDTSTLLDINKSMVLYRICQELLNNVVKYSKATECTIILDLINSKSLRLCVKDNGKGFDVDNIQKGVGLNYTINRVKVYGGNNEIKSTPGKGCEICICMPL